MALLFTIDVRKLVQGGKMTPQNGLSSQIVMFIFDVNYLNRKILWFLVI